MNRRRKLNRARRIVAQYKTWFDESEPDETAIVDLLADLKHLVAVMAGRKDPNGYLKWEELTGSAHRHFIAEVNGE